MGNYNRDDRSGSRRDFGRNSGRQRFGGNGGGGTRVMHNAVCSKCGKDCRVPFEPTGSKPVYCSDCFDRNGGGGDARRFGDRGPRRHNFERRPESRPQNNEQFEQINRKLDKIMAMLAPPHKEEKGSLEILEDITPAVLRKTKSPKKESPVAEE